MSDIDHLEELLQQQLLQIQIQKKEIEIFSNIQKIFEEDENHSLPISLQTCCHEILHEEIIHSCQINKNATVGLTLSSDYSFHKMVEGDFLKSEINSSMRYQILELLEEEGEGIFSYVE